jgi:hypothetical protein
VRDILAVRVVTNEARPEIHTLEAWPLQCEIRNFVIRQTKSQRNRFEAGTAAAQVPDPWNVIRFDQPELLEPGQRVIEVYHLLRNELKLVRGKIFRQHAALAIEYQAANRRNGFDAYTVTLGFFGEQFVLDDLQLHQSRNHGAEQHGADHCRKYHPPEEKLFLGMMVLDWREEFHQPRALDR